MIPIDAGWSDVGSWSSLWDVSVKDNLGNVSVGEVISIDSNNNYISSDSALVATIGLNDMVVVTTSDAVLIATKDKVQEVKKIVEELKNAIFIISVSILRPIVPGARFATSTAARTSR